MLFAAVHVSAIGTKQTIESEPANSDFGERADIV